MVYSWYLLAIRQLSAFVIPNNFRPFRTLFYFDQGNAVGWTIRKFLEEIQIWVQFEFSSLFPIDENKTVLYFWTFEKESQVKSHWQNGYLIICSLRILINCCNNRWNSRNCLLSNFPWQYLHIRQLQHLYRWDYC